MTDADVFCNMCNVNKARIDSEKNLHWCLQCSENIPLQNRLKRFEQRKSVIVAAAGVPHCFAGAHHEKKAEKHLGNSSFIYGPRGTGKTHMACSLLIENMKRTGKYSSKFVNMADLLAELRSCYNDKTTTESAILDKYTVQCPLLILDDIGTEKVTEWVQSIIYLIVDRRYREELQTIFTSNMDLDEISNSLGDHISSRVAGMCSVIHLDGEDRRLL